jgi:pimeloyl-ACP methyl ester carboxylesterase
VNRSSHGRITSFFTAFLMLAVAFAVTSPAQAKVQPFPAGFHPRNIPTNGTTLYVRIGGQGPAVLLIHGFGDTGDMWAPLAAELMKDHTVIVPDLRGMGLSAHPDGGYTKKNQAADIAGMLDYLKIGKVALVTHDIGNMVGYAFVGAEPGAGNPLGGDGCPAARHGDWDTIIRDPRLWHFNFRGPDVERLVAGRERIYLDRFYNELSDNPKAIDEETRNPLRLPVCPAPCDA